jgi:hypothetical protein
MRLCGSKNNYNFVQGLAMNTEKYMDGLHNPQRQLDRLDTGFKHTKSSLLFGDIVHHIYSICLEVSNQRVDLNRENNERNIF